MHTQESVRSTEKYYKLINKAEICITDEKFEEALGLYHKASKIKSLFSYDAHNALVCAVQLEKYADAVKYARILKKKGIPPAFFNQVKFAGLIRSNEWAIFKDELQEAPGFNTALRAKIDEMLVLDQKFRKDNLKYTDSLIVVDSLIRIELNILLHEYGYPSEDITGIWMHTDSTFFLWSPIDILLIHAMKGNADDLVPTLLNSIREGNMRPLKFVLLSAYISKPNDYLYSCNGSNQVVYIQIAKEIFSCCCEKEAQIDTNREKIYLENISDLKKKIEFNFRKDRRFKLNVSNAVTYLSYSKNMEEARRRIAEEKDMIVVKTLASDASYY